MKKALSFVLVMVLSLSCVLALAKDYICSDWAEENIKTARDYKLIENGNFTKAITRKEFCEIGKRLLDLCGYERDFEYFEERPFNDTESYEVAYLYNAGIIKGKSEDEFKPYNLITREEAAVILMRIMECLDACDMSAINDWAYVDHGDISEWAGDSVYAVSNKGIMKGTDKGFEPKENLSIEQTVTTFIRIYDMCNEITFADKLNKEMPRDENYMFSPFSIKMALGLAANGADGETQKEILDVLNIDNIDAYNQYAKDMIEKYSRSDKIRFDVVNSIWINKSNNNCNFSEAYKGIVTEFYNAEAGEVTNDNAVEVINSWISDKTNKSIQRAISNSDFWAMLVNAIYFKGMWEDEFSPRATKPDIFTNADGEEKEIDFMNKTDWVFYSKIDKSEIITMDYKTSFYYMDENGEAKQERNNDIDASMYIIMTDEDIDVEEELKKAKGTYKNTYMNLSVPKFEVEYSASMGEALKNIGVKRAFSHDAQFEKMFDEGNMFLTDAIHKTFIKVDEEGTEAAAITAIAMAGSALPPEPVDFKVNKPFYFAVRVDDEILFMGRFAYAE